MKLILMIAFTLLRADRGAGSSSKVSRVEARLMGSRVNGFGLRYIPPLHVACPKPETLYLKR